MTLQCKIKTYTPKKYPIIPVQVMDLLRYDADSRVSSYLKSDKMSSEVGFSNFWKFGLTNSALCVCRGSLHEPCPQYFYH